MNPKGGVLPQVCAARHAHMRTKVGFLAGALPRRLLSAGHSATRYAPRDEVEAFGAFTMSEQ